MAEKVIDQVEKGIAWVGDLITKGPIALMDMAKEFLGELQALFLMPRPLVGAIYWVATEHRDRQGC